MIRMMQESEFDMVFSLMEMSFPEDEHRPYDEQKALLLNNRYFIYVLPDSDGREIKAFIAIWKFEDFVFVEHFAVNPKYRNQGLGALVLREIREMSASRICLEVELPETEIAKRRIGFYMRNGFRYHDYEYMQPPISKGRQAIPLRIMTTGENISRANFDMLRDILYKEVYNLENCNLLC